MTFQKKVLPFRRKFVLLQTLFGREFSSAGSERLPYKQEVIGSSPITPTIIGEQHCFPIFILPFRQKSVSLQSMKTKSFKSILLVTCLLTAFTSCRHETLPEGIMDTATMAQFLTEAHLIESYDYVVVATNRDSLGWQTAAAYDSLFNKYNITQAQYDSSIAYYMSHPATFEAIYTRVVDKVKAYADSTEALVSQTDSIQPADGTGSKIHKAFNRI